MINKILNYFRPKVKLISLDSDKIKKALPKIDYSFLNPTRHFFLDKNYSSCTIEEFKDLLKKDFTNWKIYNKDYDCDNFAFRLRQNLKNKYPTMSIGIVFSTSHAFNVFIDKFGKAHYIEPQTDKIYTFGRLTKQYKPFDLIII